MTHSIRKEFDHTRSASFEELNSSGVDKKLGYAARTGNMVMPTEESAALAAVAAADAKNATRKACKLFL